MKLDEHGSVVVERSAGGSGMCAYCVCLCACALQFLSREGLMTLGSSLKGLESVFRERQLLLKAIAVWNGESCHC